MKVYLASLMFLVSFVSLSAQCLTGNCQDGLGKYKGSDFTFEGTFKGGQMFSGKAVTTDGEIYEGTFQDNSLSGENCTKTYPDNTVLKGEFKNGNLVNGTIRRSNGTVFSGKFVQDDQQITVLKEGSIKYADKSEKKGTFLPNGKLNGINCEHRYADGRILYGTFKNGDIIDGQLIYPENDPQNRDYYEGQWSKNPEGQLAQHGKGWLYFKNNSKLGPNWNLGNCTGATVANSQVQIPAGTSVIELKRRDGLFYIKGDIKNGADEYPINFVFDTGASYVKIPSYWYILLCKEGVIDDKEAVKIALQSARGEVLVGKKFVIKQIDFNNTNGEILSMKDVDAVVTPSVNDDNSPILLGNVALSQFTKIELDYSKNLLLVKK